jgi:hypothetical protein
MKVIPFFIIFVETIRDMEIMKDILILAWAIVMGLLMANTLKKKS